MRSYTPDLLIADLIDGQRELTVVLELLVRVDVSLLL